jgi:hypothetical protein
MFNRETEIQLRKALSSRVEKLKGFSDSELMALPEVTEEAIEIGEFKVMLATFHVQDDGSHSIVLQMVKRSVTGISSRVIADGFRILDGQARVSLSPEELYDYT